MGDNQTVYTGYSRSTVNWPALGSVIGFYLAILGLGLYASWRSRKLKRNRNIQDMILAGRDIGPVLGAFTMTASWLGGGYLNGTVELLYSGDGIAWNIPVWAFSSSLVLGGLFFVTKMRNAEYVTFLDPFQQKYGSVCTTFLFIPALMGEIFYCGCVLSALGSTLTVIIGIEHSLSVIISVAIAIFYTLLGGLYSVAFTDVLQLVCVFVGLIIVIPFALQHDAVGSLADTASVEGGWLGTIEKATIAMWIDSTLQLTLGNIPWQSYYQRVLSSRSAKLGKVLSYLACMGLFLGSVPPTVIGAIARSTDWNATDYRLNGEIPVPEEDYKFMLPFVLEFLCPVPVAVIGLGAVTAAVMSSCDSTMLAASSMFGHNIYTAIRIYASKKKPSDSEVLWVYRGYVVFHGVLSAILAIYVGTIFGLLFLCTDLVYCILFPQLVSVLYIPFTNSYGSFIGWWVGMALRVLSGEPVLSLKPVIKFPWYDAETDTQLFPFKTLLMLLSLFTILSVSKLAEYLFTKQHLPKSLDVFKCFDTVDDSAGDKDEKKMANGYSNNAMSHEDGINRKEIPHDVTKL